MRFLFICLLVGFVSSHAFAQVDPDPNQPQDPPPPDLTLNFTLSSPSAGCVNVDSVYASGEFPKTSKGEASELRLFYSTESFDKITQDSPYMETELFVDDQGTVKLASPGSCGFQSGSKTYFRYGLLDANGVLLKFQDNSDYQEYQDSIDVQ